MIALQTATKQSLQNALYAYLHKYGGRTLDEARAIAGAILAVREKSGHLISQGLEIEIWVAQLVEGFDPSRIAEEAWDKGEQAIAEQANHWRETLQIKAQGTVDAYIQQYLPDLNVIKIQTIVATVLPLIEDTRISRDEAKRLIRKISDRFDWPAAVGRVIDPQWLMFAAKAWQCLQNRDATTFVQEVVRAYAAQFQPTAVEIGEELIEKTLQHMVKSQIELDIDFSLDPETQKLLVKQVMFKVNLLEASPVASKSASEIAQEVYDEVTRYRRSQGLEDISYLPETKTRNEVSGDSALGGAMSVGFEPKRRVIPDTAPPETSPDAS